MLHCESIVQKGRGRVSTRHTPLSHMKPAPQVASLVQVRRHTPLTQSWPVAQGVAQEPVVGYAQRPAVHCWPAAHWAAEVQPTTQRPSTHACPVPVHW
jgi:hypothetical protein